MSMLEYSRDALAKPLGELEAVFSWIRSGRFDPDQTRSGRRVPSCAGGEGSYAEKGRPEEEAAGRAEEPRPNAPTPAAA
eukprot:6149020-Lingulodinium_polyedra.AAC.1